MSARNMLIMAPAQAAQVIVGVGAVVVFTRLMSPDDFGAYAVIMFSGMLVHTMAITWAEPSAFRFLPEAQRNHETQAHFATLLTVALAISLVCALVLLASLAASLIYGWLAVAVGCTAVWSATRFVTKVARETDRAEGQMLRYSWRETSLVVGGFGLGVALLIWTPAGVAAPFIGLAVAGLLASLFDCRDLMRRAENARPLRARITRYFAYGAPLAFGLGLEMAMQTSTRIALAMIEGPAAAGAFNASAGAVGRALDVLFIWTALAFAPALLRAYESGDRGATADAGAALARGLAAVAIPATAGLSLVAEPLCALLIGPGLAAQAAALAPTIALMGLANGLSVYLFTEAYVLSQRTGLRARLLVPVTVAHVVLLVLCISLFGVMGAGYASVISSVLGLTLLAVFGRSLLTWRWPWRDFAKVIIATAIMAAVVWATPASADWTGLLIKSLIGAVVYVGLVIALDMGGVRTWLGSIVQRRAAA